MIFNQNIFMINKEKYLVKKNNNMKKNRRTFEKE